MSFDRPGADDALGRVSDTEVNEALENDRLEKGDLTFESVEHDDAQRSKGPEPEPGRRPGPDTASDGTGDAAEPPD